jgi:hypothetical protein
MSSDISGRLATRGSALQLALDVVVVVIVVVVDDDDDDDNVVVVVVVVYAMRTRNSQVTSKEYRKHVSLCYQCIASGGVVGNNAIVQCVHLLSVFWCCCFVNSGKIRLTCSKFRTNASYGFIFCANSTKSWIRYEMALRPVVRNHPLNRTVPIGVFCFGQSLTAPLSCLNNQVHRNDSIDVDRPTTNMRVIFVEQ